MKLARKTKVKFLVIVGMTLLGIILITHTLMISYYFQEQNKALIKNAPKTRSYVLLSLLISANQENKTSYLQGFKKYEVERQGVAIDTSVTQKPRWPLQFSAQEPIKKIIETIKEKKQSAQLSYHLNNREWLNYSEQPIQNSYNLVALLLLTEVLIVGFILWHLFSIRRLRSTLKDVTYSAKNLGLDINASPLKAYGPTVVKNSIDAMNKMQIKIQELVKNRTRLLAAISHDLRTPITRLKLRSQFIEDESVVYKINKDLDEMQSMINATLAFSRNDMLHEQKNSLDVSALLSSICYDFIDTGHKVELINTVQTVKIQGRSLSLKRAFENIINNGLKYGSEVKVHTQRTKKAFEIKIADNGSGIPEAEIKEVFKAFYRSKNQRANRSTGAGLGLTIAQEVFQEHNAILELENGTDKGLIATIKIMCL